MKANRIVLVILPAAMMIVTLSAMTGAETWLAGLGKSEVARHALGRAGIAVPYIAAAGLGLV